MKKITILLLALILTFSFTACKSKITSSDSSDITSQTVDFQKPDSYAAVLKITINPEFNLYLDKDGVVLSVESLNDDAKSLRDKIEFNNKNYEDVVKSVISVANEKNFLKNGANVKVEFIEIIDTTINSDEIISKATTAVKNIATELKVEITVNKTEDTTNTNTSTESSKTSSISSTVNSQPTESSTPVVTTPAESNDKPAVDDKKEEPKVTVLNPKTDLIYEKEYAGNFRTEGTDLVGSGISFHTEGGMDDSPYCVLLSPQYEAVRTDDTQSVKVFNGKEYYSVGSGQTPHIMELTDTEIIVKKSFGGETDVITLKLQLKSNNTFVVTYSNHENFPVDTVLTYLRG